MGRAIYFSNYPMEDVFWESGSDSVLIDLGGNINYLTFVGGELDGTGSLNFAGTDVSSSPLVLLNSAYDVRFLNVNFYHDGLDNYLIYSTNPATNARFVNVIFDTRLEPSEVVASLYIKVNHGGARRNVGKRDAEIRIESERNERRGIEEHTDYPLAFSHLRMFEMTPLSVVLINVNLFIFENSLLKYGYFNYDTAYAIENTWSPFVIDSCSTSNSKYVVNNIMDFRSPFDIDPHVEIRGFNYYLFITHNMLLFNCSSDTPGLNCAAFQYDSIVDIVDLLRNYIINKFPMEYLMTMQGCSDSECYIYENVFYESLRIGISDALTNVDTISYSNLNLQAEIPYDDRIDEIERGNDVSTSDYHYDNSIFPNGVYPYAVITYDLYSNSRVTVRKAGPFDSLYTFDVGQPCDYAYCDSLFLNGISSYTKCICLPPDGYDIIKSTLFDADFCSDNYGIGTPCNEDLSCGETIYDCDLDINEIRVIYCENYPYLIPEDFCSGLGISWTCENIHEILQYDCFTSNQY